VRAAVIGKTGGEEIVIGHRGRGLVRVRVEQARRAWKLSLPEFFKTSG
jgi:hypothetical protein